MANRTIATTAQRRRRGQAAIVEDPDPGQADQHDRELEHEPEGQDHRRHEADVAVDRQQRLQALPEKPRRNLSVYGMIT